MKIGTSIFQELGTRMAECGMKPEQVMAIPACIVHSLLNGDLTLIVVTHGKDKLPSYGFSAARRDMDKWVKK